MRAVPGSAPGDGVSPRTPDVRPGQGPGSVVPVSWRGGVFSGRGFGVGLTVADLSPVPPEFGPPVTSSPALAEMLPVYARTAAEKAAELRRVPQLEAEPAA